MRRFLKELCLVVLVLSVCLASIPLSYAQKTTGRVLQYNTPMEYFKATGKRITKFKEAPMLTELVKQGKLPPVEKRLPEEPLVVVPTKEIGKYGGTLRGSSLNPQTWNDIEDAMVDGLFRFSNDLKEILPNVAKGYLFSDKFKKCTIYLRKGIKWSDGEPFTADDILFWWEDIILNDELTPIKPDIFRPGGRLMNVKKINDYTVQFEFAVSYPSFPLIHYSAAPYICWAPKHYLKKYHIKYNPEANTLAKQEKFDTWYKCFAFHQPTSGWGWQDPNTPTLQGWILKSHDSQRRIFERNPYYWKIDTEGNQLPYIDRAIVEFHSNIEVANLKAVSGELDIAGHDLLPINYPLLKENEAKGKYKVVLARSTKGNDVTYAINLNNPDPVKRKIFQDVRFRRALSLAINREEINKLHFLGSAIPRQATVNPNASFYKESWGKAYAQYDPDTANKLLDEMGLKRGPDGYRLRPDGKRLEILVDYMPYEGPKGDVSELVKMYWEKIGIKVEIQPRERAFQLTRVRSSQHDISCWHIDRTMERCVYTYSAGNKLYPPGDSATIYAWNWGLWLQTDGKSGEEPPKIFKDIWNAYWQWRKYPPGTSGYKYWAQKIFDIYADQVYIIGTVGLAPWPLLIRENLENVFWEKGKDEEYWFGPDNWLWNTYRAEQWFFK